MRGKFLGESIWVLNIYIDIMGERRKRPGKEIDTFFQRPNILQEILNRRLIWGGIHGKNTDQNNSSFLGGTLGIVITLIRLYIIEKNLINIDKNINSVNKMTVTHRCQFL